MPTFRQQFPYDEIRRTDGDYFHSRQEANDAGHDDSHVWSVIESEGVWSYGPPHHYVNVLGYIATKESHDGDTYYEEDDPTPGDFHVARRLGAHARHFVRDDKAMCGVEDKWSDPVGDFIDDHLDDPALCSKCRAEYEERFGV